MMRFFAGVAACFLMMTGAFLLWQGKAQEPTLPAAPALAGPAPVIAAPSARSVLRAPEASPKSREQKRFARADKDDDGRITAAELFEPRRKAFAKLDKNGNGALSFDEWAAKTVDKFGSADADRSGFLTPAEFATTAPKPSKRKAACACG
ncbi:EF-hand domain-containing protein [Sphingomonas arenae]|uniref:EF-hand domain-containing protein n=1 Tax=Sphingomonas arenae TaxID=2812555 RepID=UPI0019678EF1|nr:EF-hand domain-containing protein [Sphingomonas arenae]